MKAIFTIILVALSSTVFCQFDLYLSAGTGFGNYYNKIERDNTQSGFELKPIFAGSIGADISWVRHSGISPFLGLNFTFTGADQQHLSNVFPEYHFRFQYITVPIGLRIPIFKSLGFEASCVNSFQIANKSRNIDLPKTVAWDIAVQPAIYYQYKSWRGGLSYYFGINDALGIGYLGELDFRYFNRIILFNLAYRLHTFN